MKSKYHKYIGVIILLTVILNTTALPQTIQPALKYNSYSPENLLPNPSFSTGQKSPDGWIFRAWSDTQKNAQWDIDPSGRTGRCVTILSENNKGTDAAWTTTITVKPNTFYRLSGWIRTKNLRGATGALLNIQNMQHIKTKALSQTNDWTKVSTVFRTAEKPTQIEINCLFGGWGKSTGQAWYDDIALEYLEYLCTDYATVTVDLQAPQKPYSPLIFGGFIEHFHHQIYGGIFQPGSPLSDDHGFRKDVIEAMKELKISIVRWPGGCFASGYQWTDGVGPERRSIPDPVWGVQESNKFGTDEFVSWCRLIGAEPYICTNAGNGTPDQMKAWVQYCNGAKGGYAQKGSTGGNDIPLNVRYWSIGNENWGDHEIGAKTPQQWGPLVKKSAQLMLSADPELILLAAATPNRNWVLPLLEAAGDYLNYVCIHQYWLGYWHNNAMPDYLSCIMHSTGPEQTIEKMIGILDKAGYRGRIKIAFDEWNLRGWHHPGFPRKTIGDLHDPKTQKLIQARDKNAIPAQYTMADALFSASFLNACLRHSDDVAMANIAPIVNTRGPLYVHPKGIVKRTTFHTLAMYANLLGDHVVDSKIDAGFLVHGDRFIPLVDAIVTIDNASIVPTTATAPRTWTIALINRHPSKNLDCTLRLKEIILNGTFNATILTGDSPQAYNSTEHPNRVIPEKKKITIKNNIIKLPPHSLTIIKIPTK